MVSAASSSTQKQPLSYADSARKARGIRDATSPVTQRKHPQNPSAPSASTVPIPQGGNMPAVTPNSSAQSTLPAVNGPLLPSSPPPEAEVGSKSTNGSSHHSSTDAAVDSSSSSAVKTSNPPTMNVWNVRKERMAQALAQSQQSRSAVSVPQRPGDNARITDFPSVAEASDTAQLHSTSPRVSHDQHTDSNNSDQSIIPSVVSAAMPPNKASKGDEPWSAGPSVVQNASSLPHLGDTTAWPEVGKGVTASSSSSRSRGGVVGNGVESKGEGQEMESEHTAPRKSEKPKWVPIPPEELQAAVDEQRSKQSRRNGHGRSRSQHRPEVRGIHVTQASASTSASASASVSIAPSVVGGVSSKGHSRAQSAVRDRVSSSRAPSLPQSQAQSRTGSVQSSPRHIPRGTRLPEENGRPVESIAPSTASRSVHSSRAASPQSQSRSYLQVSTSTNVGVPIPVQPTIPVAGVNPAQLQGDPQRPPYSEGRGSPYFPLPPPTMGSYPLNHTPNPSVASPYPVVASGYSISPSVPPPYTGTSPYPPYPPYPYAYGSHPYPPYWAPPRASPDATVSYPIPHSQPMTQLPPPAPDSRRQGAVVVPSTSGSVQPPAPHHPGDAALPQSGTETSPQPTQPRRANEKGRTRVLSFGSIIVAGSSTPASPAPGITTLDDATETKSQAEAGSSKEQSADPSGPSESGIEGLFSRFAIDVRSDEGLSALRRMTDGGESARAGDAASVKVADVAAQDRKWEFGTAQLPEDEGEPAVYTPANEQLSPPTATEGAAAQSFPHKGGVSGVGTQTGPASPAGKVTRSETQDHTNGDPFTVKDYGYGFGRKAGPGVVNPGGRQGEDHAHWKDRDVPTASPGGRPRRGSYNGVNGYDKSFGGRGRGRGRGYGRGYSGRGGNRQYSGSPTAPPPRKLQLPPEFEDEAAYYSAMQSPTVAYVAPGYEHYNPYLVYPPAPVPPAAYTGAPLPVPATKVSFPLDWTRYHLLGQLEYYLGADNLAHDLFLRQKMDKCGWIPIHVLATFPRVRNLTYDQQLVKDILTISSLVEVRSEWVRIHRWEQYVLPDAPESTVQPATSAGPRDEGSISTAEGELSGASTDHASDGSSLTLNSEMTAFADAGTTSSNTYMPQAGYTEREYTSAHYEYYPAHIKYPSVYAGHNGGYVPDHRERTMFNAPAEGQTLREEPGQGEGQTEVVQVDFTVAHATPSEQPLTENNHEESDENEESEELEELESDESEVEFVLGKDANRSWTPERKQGSQLA